VVIKNIFFEIRKKKLFKKNLIFCQGSGFYIQEPELQIFFQKIPKLNFYYAMWTLRIEVVNGKKTFVIVFSVFI
jgi:hypothetical protein